VKRRQHIPARIGDRRALGRRSLVAVLLVATGCFGDRERPGPTEVGGTPDLSVRILAPPTGATVLTGVDIAVRVEARDLALLHLEGVGFVARRVTGGTQLVDSAAVRFALQSDTTHEFTFRMPNSFATNTQVDVYGIAFGRGGVAELSAPVHVVVVQCPNGICP
jgi:hypothetical protein